MSASEGVAAAVFYVALAATVGGAMTLARGAVERRSGPDRAGIVITLLGLIGVTISIGVYLAGPRRLLPF